MRTWEQAVWDFLCELIKNLGGDCDVLPPRPPNPTPYPNDLPAAITKVEAHYNTHGLPSFPTQADKDKFLALLNAIEAHLNLAGNTLPPAADAQLRALIAAMRAAMP